MNAKWNTSSPPVSPSQGRRVRDKIEVSPTSRATCRCCINTIMKGETRVGIQGKVEVQQGIMKVWRLHWYHERCLTASTKSKLYLAGAQSPASVARKAAKKASPSKKRAVTIDDNDKKPAAKKAKPNTTSSPTKTEEKKPESKLSTAVVTPIKKKRTRHMLIPSIRKSLETDLRSCRKCFAQIQHCEECKIYPHKTLQDIIRIMPANKTQLLKCWGIAGKRCDQYGEPILQIVGSYLDRYQYKTWKQQQQQQGEDGNSTFSSSSSGGDSLSSTNGVVGGAVNNHHVAAAASASTAGVQSASSAVNNAEEVSDDEDDEVVEAGPTLSVEEIVRQRVREAEERGEVFEILD